VSSCAYYNTFYLAKKYYDVASLRQPYLVDKPQTVDTQNFNKSIEYSKKVLAQYPKSKWVDDAYLLWARGLLGKDDPVEVVNMLQDFETRYPKSAIHEEATFYLGVAYRHAHKYAASARTLDDFLAKAPKHDLAPYAYLERARALNSLEQYADAAASAGKILERWPKSRLEPMARAARAEASFKAGDYTKAREDFRQLGFNSRDDDERLAFLMREADCLEAGQAYDQEMALLKGAQSHEPPPPPQPEPVIGTGTGPAPAPMVVQSAPPPGSLPANDHYGQLMVRIGTVAMLQGHLDEAVRSYHSVVRDYPHTPLAAEAQYRIAYAYETVGDDFDKARAEYGRVRDIASSAFVTQAAQRLENLDRLSKFRSATKDTVETKAETAFLLAEQYLFQVNKPDRAIEQYRKIEQDFAGTKWSAKAIVAQAWVLSRKLGRKAEADSLFWLAVRDHPATEAQLAARDYLEMEGAEVPDTLIKLPEVPVQQLAAADSVTLTPVPQGSTPLGAPQAQNTAPDSLGLKPPGGALGVAALGAGTALMHSPDSTLVGPEPPGSTAVSPQAIAAPPGATDPPVVTGPPAPGTAAAAGAGAAAVGAPAVTGPPAPGTAAAAGAGAGAAAEEAPAVTGPPAPGPAAAAGAAPLPPSGPAAAAATGHAAAGHDSTSAAPPDTSATHPSAPPDTSAQHRKP
jgi:tetratricopeptide (TPR) repeat protein